MSKTCTQCGAVTVAEARFCRSCGAALGTQPLPKDSPTESQLPSTTSFGKTRVDTGGLPPELPGTVSFDTVVDPGLLRGGAPPEPPAAPHFDPRATQFDARRTQFAPFDPSAEEDDQSLTSALSPQKTMNLGATVPGFHMTEALSQEQLPAPPAAEPQPPPASAQASPSAPAIPPATREFSLPSPPPPHSQPLPPQQANSIPLPPPIFTAPEPAAQAPHMVQPMATTGTAFAAPAPPPAKSGIKGWQIALIAIVLLLLVGGLGAAAFFVVPRLLSRQNATPAPTPIPAVTPSGKSTATLLSEAEALLASGDAAGAAGRLREVVQMDPANAGAQRQLGDALIKVGDRTGAIDAYRAATQADPKDKAAWQALAAAQFDEGLYTESVESYRQVIALSGGAPSEDVELAYADALRTSGQTDEAKATYEKLARSSSPEMAANARRRLTELAQLGPQATPVPEPTRLARLKQTPVPTPAPTTIAQIEISRPTPVPTPAPTQPPKEAAPSTPAEHYRRGVELWGSNRAAAVKEFLAARSVPDANYYLGLNIAEGRSPESLGRAELVSALFYFQAAQSGSHGGQARRYADILGKEYDRRRGGN